jgi:protein-tyrosine-phosphatase
MRIEMAALRRRAAVHAALAEPARLAVVEMLALGDASPSELGKALEMPSNLLAHHLRVLEKAGMIDRVRSEADHRRIYVRLTSVAFAGSLPAAALRAPRARRVVFVCTYNSTRSPLAAALWRKYSQIPVASAGTRPHRRVHQRAVTTARRHGLALDANSTAHVRDVVRADDLIIVVCDNAYEELGRNPRRLHWSVPDPAQHDTYEAFEAAFNDLKARVERLAAAVDRPFPSSAATI